MLPPEALAAQKMQLESNEPASPVHYTARASRERSQNRQNCDRNHSRAVTTSVSPAPAAICGQHSEEREMPLSSYGILPVGASVHDALPINHSNPLSSPEVLPVGASVHDTLPINHSNPLSSHEVLPVGASVHDTLPTNNPIPHLILEAPPNLDIDVSDSKHLLTGNQAALLKADMAKAATEWLDLLGNRGHTPINILIN